MRRGWPQSSLPPRQGERKRLGQQPTEREGEGRGLQQLEEVEVEPQQRGRGQMRRHSHWRPPLLSPLPHPPPPQSQPGLRWLLRLQLSAICTLPTRAVRAASQSLEPHAKQLQLPDAVTLVPAPFIYHARNSTAFTSAPEYFRQEDSVRLSEDLWKTYRHCVGFHSEWRFLMRHRVPKAAPRHISTSPMWKAGNPSAVHLPLIEASPSF